jgi:hypothetical protein
MARRRGVDLVWGCVIVSEGCEVRFFSSRRECGADAVYEMTRPDDVSLELRSKVRSPSLKHNQEHNHHVPCPPAFLTPLAML